MVQGHFHMYANGKGMRLFGWFFPIPSHLLVCSFCSHTNSWSASSNFITGTISAFCNSWKLGYPCHHINEVISPNHQVSKVSSTFLRCWGFLLFCFKVVHKIAVKTCESCYESRLFLEFNDSEFCSSSWIIKSYQGCWSFFLSPMLIVNMKGLSIWPNEDGQPQHSGPNFSYRQSRVPGTDN